MGFTRDAGTAEAFIDGYSQVVCVYDDGGEAVMNPCVETASAERLAELFTATSQGKGRRAVARHLKLPCLAGNLDLERQRRFSVNLRRFETVS